MPSNMLSSSKSLPLEKGFSLLDEILVIKRLQGEFPNPHGAFIFDASGKPTS
jgi:hypothetical protein